jgi:hypothetical protein
MDAHDFITYPEYLEIRELVLHQQDVNFTAVKKEKYQFGLRSGMAKWENKTVCKGDYVLFWEANRTGGGYSGSSGPIEKSNCEEMLKSYRDFVRFVDLRMKHIAGDAYVFLTESEIECIEESEGCQQISLF